MLMDAAAGSEAGSLNKGLKGAGAAGQDARRARTPAVKFEDGSVSSSRSRSSSRSSSSSSSRSRPTGFQLSASVTPVVHEDGASEDALLTAMRQEWMNGLVLELAMRLTDPQAAEAVAAVMGLEDKTFLGATWKYF